MKDYTITELTQAVKNSFAQYDKQARAAERGINMNQAMDEMVASDHKKVSERTT